MADLTLRTPLCDLLDIKYPIVLAGMGGAASPELASMFEPNDTKSRSGPVAPEPDIDSITSRGFASRSTSQPRPRFGMTRALLFSTKTSAVLMSAMNAALPSGVARSSTRSRLLRFMLLK